MKHEITELYKLTNDERHIYSAEAIKNYPKIKHFFKYDPPKEVSAYPISWRVNSAKPFRIYDTVGSKEYRFGYMYGDKAYFDTEEERTAYRMGVKKLEEERKAKTFNLEGMTIKELKTILETRNDDEIIEKGMFKVF